MLDAGEQARPEPPPPLVAVVDIEAAGAKLENPLQYLDRPAQRAGIGERPEQPHALVSRLRVTSIRGKSSRVVICRYGNVLSSFSSLVVFGLNVLDQPRFHEQGIDLAVAEDEIGIGDFADPIGRPALGLRSFQEIAAGSAAKGFGLADIDHAAGGVFHQVNARRARELRGLWLPPGERRNRARRFIGGYSIEGRIELGFVDDGLFGGGRLGRFLGQQSIFGCFVVERSDSSNVCHVLHFTPADIMADGNEPAEHAAST